MPTCHRASFDNFLEDVDYLAAVENSDGITRKYYVREASKIAEVQRGILSTCQKEEPFDVFICYKETDDDGNRTKDSALAQDIYYQLTDHGLRVFFARITLEDKAGSEYEPYIFAALNSAKVMITVSTRPEHMNAVWVKNEWSRFLSIIKKDRSKVILPCYRDMDPYDLPEQLSVLQSYDMTKIGFIQDLVRGIRKIISTDVSKAPVNETKVADSGTNIAPLLERVFLFLEDGKWQDADSYCEKVLDIDPKNAEAYLGKLMAELKTRTRAQLGDCAKPFDNTDNFQKILRFGEGKIQAEIKGYVDKINDRNEAERLTNAYSRAVNSMNAANTESAYKAAFEQFNLIASYKDAETLAGKCLEMAEELYRDKQYDAARSLMVGEKESTYEEAIEHFKMIHGWKDSYEQIDICRRKIEQIKEKKEADRIEAEKKAEKDRLEAEYREQELKDLTLVIVSDLKYWKEIRKESPLSVAIWQKSEECRRVERIIAEYDEVSGILVDLNIQSEYCNKQIEVIEDRKRSLGLFSGKEKKQLDHAIPVLLEERRSIEDAICDQQKRLCGFRSKEEAVRLHMKLEDEKKILEKKLNEAATSGNVQYNIAQIKQLLMDNSQLLQRVNDIYPLSRLLFASEGECINFGAYKQDELPPKPIEWIVLEKANDRLLALSRYSLDCKQFDDTYANVAWETCSLRKWMNNDFMQNAFTEEEKRLILMTDIQADKNPDYNTFPGNVVSDKVFLLSINQVERYFYGNRQKQCVPSKYTVTKLLNAGDKHAKGDNSNCRWWLRTPGFYQSNAAFVDYEGSVDNYGSHVDDMNICIRPAIWISLD